MKTPNKNFMLRVRMTNEEKTKLQELATLKNVGMSKLIRSLIEIEILKRN